MERQGLDLTQTLESLVETPEDKPQAFGFKEFTAEEAIYNCAKHGGEGPWDDDLYAQMQQRDAWLREPTDG